MAHGRRRLDRDRDKALWTFALALLPLWVGGCGDDEPDVDADSGRVVYVSPQGSDANPGTLHSPFKTLIKARDVVRTLNGGMESDVHVVLRGGLYSIESPITLDARDSGSNGFRVVYRAYEHETPVLSGGRPVEGWVLWDPARNVYRAYAGRDLKTRQFYVNSVRATRARGPLYPSGWARTSAGFTAPDDTMAGWRNIADVEIVCLNLWKAFRCGVAAVYGREVVMEQPCWGNAQLHSAVPMNSVTWVENAYELLDEDGEWYHDRATGYLYYRPRNGEDLSTALSICPTTETLLEARGTLADPVHDLQFQGLTFAYSTWIAPSTEEGYASLQAGICLVGWNFDWSTRRTPGAINFSAARNIRFERNTFTHMGSAGLNFQYGSKDIEVIGNTFEDLSSSAVLISDDSDNPIDPREQATGYALRNNLVRRVAQEYFDAAGIWAGYVADLTIECNDIQDLPYSGISVGWGWGTSSYARNNHIKRNRIVNTMLTLKDGGAVYTLSAQPGSTVSGNYIDSTERGLYHDQGSAYFTDRDNVVRGARLYWLILWTPSIHDNDIQRCWHDTDNTWNAGTNNTVANNAFVANDQWPGDALSVMQDAGLEPEFQDLRNAGR